MICLKRVYDVPTAEDGWRVLCDRLWPRGLSKDAAQLDEWLKEVGPSNTLRKWFGHDPDKFAEFAARYRAELVENTKQAMAMRQLREMVGEHPVVTLVYGAKDERHNQAIVLADLLQASLR